MTTTMQEGTVPALTPKLVEFRDGLRELADWIDQHPDEARALSLSYPVKILAPTGVNPERLRALGVALDVPFTTDGTYAQHVRTFGDVLEVRAYAHLTDVCDYKVVGEQTTQVREWRLKDPS